MEVWLWPEPILRRSALTDGAKARTCGNHRANGNVARPQMPVERVKRATVGNVGMPKDHNVPPVPSRPTPWMQVSIDDDAIPTRRNRRAGIRQHILAEMETPPPSADDTFLEVLPPGDLIPLKRQLENRRLWVATRSFVLCRHNPVSIRGL